MESMNKSACNAKPDILVKIIKLKTFIKNHQIYRVSRQIIYWYMHGINVSQIRTMPIKLQVMLNRVRTRIAYADNAAKPIRKLFKILLQ